MFIKDVDRVWYGVGDIKVWMGMFMRVVWFCYENYVLYRDIKLNNLFIVVDGEVKFVDFGLVRGFFDLGWRMMVMVIICWYCFFEFFFGVRYYLGVVDIWFVGMVFVELII